MAPRSAEVAICADRPLDWNAADLKVTNVASPGEADIELQDVLEPYRLKLTREPDPKGSTSSTPSEPSKAETGTLT